MALSGVITNAHAGWTMRVEWSATQSVTDNTSTITCVHKLVCAKGYDLYVSGRSNRCYVDGTPVYYSSPSISTAGNQTITLGTTKHTVAHNDDGSKSCQITSYFYVRATLSGTYTEYLYARETVTLDTIARASQPSCVTWPEHTQNVGNFGSTISIHMNRKSDSFTHTVRYAYGSLSGTIATGVTTGTTWTIPKSFMDLIPATTSGSGTIYVDTYNGSTKIGTKSCGFTATVPTSADCYPTCTLTLDDVNNIDTIYGSPVQGLSKIKITVNPTLAYSSPIASYSITANGTKYTASPATTGVLTAPGGSPVNVTITDRRGRSGSASYTMTVLAYRKPSISALTVHRCDQDGTENDQGKWVRVTFSASITKLVNAKDSTKFNPASYVLRYKKTSAESWTTQTLTALGGTYTVNNYSYIFAADEASPYDVEVTATDAHASTTRQTSASTAFALMDFHPQGNGIRFGGIAEEENSFQNDLWLIQTANRYCFSSIGAETTDGYILMARIEITATNADSPMTFVFSRRKATMPMTVHVCFNATEDLKPGLSFITYEGDNYGAFLVQASNSVWNLYVQKVNQSDTVTLNDWYTSYRQMKRMTVTFPGTIVAGSAPSVLGTFYRAVPAIPRSILDAFMPVGYVLTLHDNHTTEKMNPNVMYPGTSWVRIENRFLWATTSGGTIGQTGGASTHTLTAAEMPAHTHTIRWNDAVNPAVALSSTNASGNGTSGSGYILSYTKGTVYTDALVAGSTGSGAAHNNMPPYVQVSIWRRTS